MENPIRVLMVVPNYPYPVVGGLEKQAHELSKALVALGHRVFAVSYAHDPSQASTEMVDGVEVHRIGHAGAALWNHASALVSLLGLMLKLRNTIDIVHVHNTSWFGVSALEIAQMLKKATLVKLANVGEMGIPGLQQGQSGRLRLAIIRQSDGIVAMAPQSLEELASIKFPKTRILFRPNGIRLSPRVHVAQPSDPSSVRVTFAGRLSWEKRLPDLLNAWARLSPSPNHAILRIVGDGPDRADLEILIEKLGISSSVEMVGRSDAVEAILESSDVFVLPSHIEGNSNAVLEAMRAALPVVASRLSGTSLQVGAEGAALLFEVGDVDALANLLDRMITNPQLRQIAGEAMRRRVETHFSIEHVAIDYERAYRVLLGQSAETLDAIQSASEPAGIV